MYDVPTTGRRPLHPDYSSCQPLESSLQGGKNCRMFSSHCHVLVFCAAKQCKRGKRATFLVDKGNYVRCLCRPQVHASVGVDFDQLSFS